MSFQKKFLSLKFFFGLSNGPLLFAVIAWNNKLVFHDLDKLTSLFIHLFPPLLTYNIRWQTDLYKNATDNDLKIWPNEIVYMILFYVLWQVLYVFKTEYLDVKKFLNDSTLMSSARWLSSVQPHPVYILALNRGWKVTPTQMLVPFQLFYTVITVIPILFIYQYKYMHIIYILLVFGFSVWQGASFYFESFTDSYTKRLEDKIKKFYDKDNKTDQAKRASYLPTIASVVAFLLFFGFALMVLLGLLKITVLRNMSVKI